MIDENIRLAAVERFKILDLDADFEFQELLQMASETCDTPIALLTLIDKDTQWLKVRQGTDVTNMPRESSFCTYTIKEDTVMVVPDAQEDERFVNSEIVANNPHIRFYAGAPLITRNGQRIGSLCVVDTQPHELSKQQQLMLKMLSRQAINLMELRISIEMLERNKIDFEQQQEVIKKAQISQRSFFESAPNFHILLNKNAAVIDFNKVAHTFIKRVHRAELKRGDRFITYIAPDFLNKFNKGFKCALEGKNIFEEGFTDYGEHGIIYWEASFETAKDTDNEIIGVSYIIRDVSDRKIKEIKIVDQNRSLINIAHLQTHELRAPLTTIMGMMDLIKAEDYNASKEYFGLLEGAIANFDEKIREIVDDIDSTVNAK